MLIEFTKMHGLGNDFIVIDLRKKGIKDITGVVKRLSDRRFGIGFDQALVLKGSKKADFRMDIYNNDGTRVEMCGNGIRCLAAYIWRKGLSRKRGLQIETLSGVIRPEKANGLVRVDMLKPRLDARDMPAKAKGNVINRPLRVGKDTLRITCVSMGNPHCVVFVDDVEACPVVELGPKIETHPFFPKKANVEFVEVVNRHRLKMRVWERGAGETLACGTGACASVVAAYLNGLAEKKANVILRGGVLAIEWAKDGHVYMTGPATEVFEGRVKV
jgi:diaminopimelate epimerase